MFLYLLLLLLLLLLLDYTIRATPSAGSGPNFAPTHVGKAAERVSKPRKIHEKSPPI
jgi:hypothetical protein